MYCVLGVAVDDITMPSLVARIHRAASARKPLFISTPNLNYLMMSQRDPAFKGSLLESDLCPADGVGVLLICRLLGSHRLAGCGLRYSHRTASHPNFCRQETWVAFLGGEPGVGERAREALNRGGTERLVCVAAIAPG